MGHIRGMFREPLGGTSLGDQVDVDGGLGSRTQG